MSSAVVCPKCGAHTLSLSKYFEFARIWIQYNNEPPSQDDYEEGTDITETDDGPIECICHSCDHIWAIDGSIYDYLK